MHATFSLTIKPVDVPDPDFTVAPHGAHHGVQLAALESTEGHPQVLSIHDVAQRTLVHVQNNQQRVRYDEGVVGLQEGRVGLARPVLSVVVELAAAQVPAPRLSVAAHQGRVAHWVEGGFARCHPHHGVGSALPHGPADLPDVQSPRVAHASPDGVCALRHRVPVENHPVVVLDEDV